jgi:ribosomal protein S12 methylthiotransferase
VKFSVITLGCDKNTVDSERIVATLVAHGADYIAEPRDAEVLLVNTCGFIDAAKQESIDTLLQAARLKDAGQLRVLVAVGCLVERYRRELQRSLPEVDLFLGLRDLPELVPKLAVRGLLDGRVQKHPGSRLPVGDLRHVSYLKISEGCDHTCAFCAIPLWRGRHRSFDPQVLVEEARALEARGVVELNLVAQDLAHYGRDLDGQPGLQQLLEQLLAATGIPWFRLLYVYSAGLRPSLVEVIAREDRILPYVDMPIQHASPRILERMRRPERPERLRELIAWLRSEIPDLTLRSSVVVGFPGETDEDFEALLEFVEVIEFDHLGAFAFSPQEGTVGAAMPDQLPDSLKLERLASLNELQRSIVAARNRARIGKRVEVLIDRVPDERGSPQQIEARMRSQAYEIDGVTFLERSEITLAPGDLAVASINNADDADLWGVAEERIRAGQRPREHIESLRLDLETVWGR